jgi:hypothetical protein
MGKLSDERVQVFSTDPMWGCLGFLNQSTFVDAVFAFGIPTVVFGSAGYTVSLLFFSPLVTSNAYLLEPFSA